MRTEPTEIENRAAIDALKAEGQFPQGYRLFELVCIELIRRIR